MAPLDRWEARARQLRAASLALSLACKDPRSRWYAVLLAGLVTYDRTHPTGLVC